ncbi:MAG: proton-conducting transporter membrane subunit [Candidatus Omnitrophica bacterium]|nr:proton-conducting transporter membrane subunit [Candidatus Omnitrophota bacterium]HOX54533.1 proton-conducting transporter membrane subunit [Candidatus Omnitrophota bacterium]
MSALIAKFYPMLIVDNLSRFIFWAILLFGALIAVYSFRFMKEKEGLAKYYLYLIFTIIASLGVVLSNNLILLLVFWGFLGFTLYSLINIEASASATAKKTLIIVGGTDTLMLLGIAIIWNLSQTFRIDQMRIALDQPIAVFAYILLACACFAKAGALPFHSWVPDCAKDAPLPVVALLPASLDKLLGIYLLVRLSLNIFVMNNAMNLFLMIVGAVTIVAAVIMALVQHDLKRLLGYHAVSQVGYMVLGIGTGSLIGIAGSIFHMLNNAIYKSCLFLTAGDVESQTKTTDLDMLGGLAKFMPITFAGALIASFSISGVPPFNGFVSKWMIYQGLVERIAAQKTVVISVLCLLAAMFGSALTLASFMKLIHAAFLGTEGAHKKVSEVHWTMWLPVMILALLCAVFGIFAKQIPLNKFVFPAVGAGEFVGFWASSWATLLILFGILIGFLIYFLGNTKGLIREDNNYIGGGAVGQDERVSGVDFYNAIRELKFFKYLYKKEEGKYFDIYEQGKNLLGFVGKLFQFLHNGVLPTYLVWALLGTAVLFLTLIR